MWLDMQVHGGRRHLHLHFHMHVGSAQRDMIEATRDQT